MHIKTKINNDHLSVMLDEFNMILTWTKDKKTLKTQILSEVDRLNLKKIVVSKKKFQLNSFGQSKIIDTNKLNIDMDLNLDLLSNAKKIQLICLDQEHCVYRWIAIREL